MFCIWRIWLISVTKYLKKILIFKIIFSNIFDSERICQCSYSERQSLYCEFNQKKIMKKNPEERPTISELVEDTRIKSYPNKYIFNDLFGDSEGWRINKCSDINHKIEENSKIYSEMTCLLPNLTQKRFRSIHLTPMRRRLNQQTRILQKIRHSTVPKAIRMTRQ